MTDHFCHFHLVYHLVWVIYHLIQVIFVTSTLCIIWYAPFFLHHRLYPSTSHMVQGHFCYFHLVYHLVWVILVTCLLPDLRNLCSFCLISYLARPFLSLSPCLLLGLENFSLLPHLEFSPGHFCCFYVSLDRSFFLLLLSCLSSGLGHSCHLLLVYCLTRGILVPFA